MVDVRWLADGSTLSVASALREVAPWLVDQPIVVRDVPGRDDPLWSASSARVGSGFVAKFAWSEPAARRLAHEIAVVTALRETTGVPYLPEIVASSRKPVLLVTRRIDGRSLFDVVDHIDRDRAGHDLGRFLAMLHRPETSASVQAVTGTLPDVGAGPQHPADTADLRRLRSSLRPDQWPAVEEWCAWADATLARRVAPVLVHADLHGDNQLWDGDRLRLVVDFETAGAGEPEYDLRALPGIGPGADVLRATMAHYRAAGGRPLDLGRVMAWHVRTVLGDALWRSQAGIPMPDGRTAAAWVDDLSRRLVAVGR
jgi:aminoglycoside phosphotransferase (APT) family kinase protein